MSCCIVGHGRSILDASGIDDHEFIVRLREAPRGGNLGTKTSVTVATTSELKHEGIPFWFYTDQSMPHAIDKTYWLDWFKRFEPKYKPSCGMIALFGVKQFKDYESVTLYGFDSHNLEKMQKHYKYDPRHYIHDAQAEVRAAKELFRIKYGT